MPGEISVPGETSVPNEVTRPAAVAAAGYLSGFLAALRRAGVRVPLDKQADFLRVLAGAPPPGPAGLYWYARITLVTDVAELAAFDRVFGEWFRYGPGQPPTALPPPDAAESEARSPRGGGDGDLPLRDAVQG
ncbi:MAG: hypothetical protein J2P25_15570, partial [Nocardiopsaceae bacterium]|nr:hypothetical protein [Nocardiopsaceae bacterium]